MQQETPHEFRCVQRHGLVACAATRTIVLPAEGNAALVERDEALVGDGYPMRVARQIREHRFWSRERSLGINHPFACAQWREPLSEERGVCKRGVLTEEPQLAATVCSGELLQEAAPEQS